MHNQSSRKEKIDLLQGIANRRISIDVLLPCKFRIEVGFGKPPKTQFYLNNKLVSEEVFLARIKQEPHFKNKAMPFSVSYCNKTLQDE